MPLCRSEDIPTVYEELIRAKRVGYSFVDDILDVVEIVLLSDEEFRDFRNLLESVNNLHEGECQLIVLCKSRGGILLTNDAPVKRHCDRNNINYLDLEEILRSLKRRNVLQHNELKKLILDIEKKDRTIIRSKEDILGN
ncbi:MAG: hypothetical protein EF813_00145 [Methanosarcinales archaeon]|nr:MAG: hypothetical protein EF813_00145 [Methanosarcinales archaeon]